MSAIRYMTHRHVHNYPKHPTTGFQVYFIKPVGMDGPIKIGCSTHPRARLAQLAEWSPVPLEVVVTINGYLDLERNIHECFADDHSHREWFRASPRLLATIEALKAGVEIAKAVDLTDRRGSIHSKKIQQTKALRGTSQEAYSL